MAGIQRKRQICDTAHLLYRPEHHLFFVNSPHTHVHIQNLGSALFLLLSKLQHLVKTALPKLSLQELLPRGIDPLPHNEKAVV